MFSYLINIEVFNKYIKCLLTMDACMVRNETLYITILLEYKI